MANLRLLTDNAAFSATLTASSTAGALAVTRLQGGRKTDYWRSTSTSATLTATWATSTLVSVVSLAFCNLTVTSLMRVRGYADVAGITLLFDTGNQYANPMNPIEMTAWGVEPLGVNPYTYLESACATLYVNPTFVRRLQIDITDTKNLAGYVQAGFLVVGGCWEASKNPDWGAPLTLVDSSKTLRDDAGGLITDAGFKSRKLTVNLNKLGAEDRAIVFNLLAQCGKKERIFLSLYPESLDSALELSHQLYGKLVSDSAMPTTSYNTYTAQLDLEEL